jgi:hypothetical protein
MERQGLVAVRSSMTMSSPKVVLRPGNRGRRVEAPCNSMLWDCESGGFSHGEIGEKGTSKPRGTLALAGDLGY